MNPALTVLSLIVGFLGGGIINALITWLRLNRSEKREKKIQFLNTQLQLLYGPLYFLTSQSKELNKFCTRIVKEYADLYKAKKIPEGKNLKKATEEIGALLEVLGTYAYEFFDINKNIKDILDKNNSHCDPDDMEIFVKFCLNYLLWQKNTQIKQKFKTQIPTKIKKKIDDIFFMDEEFNNRIKMKFFKKKSDLEELIGNNLAKGSRK